MSFYGRLIHENVKLSLGFRYDISCFQDALFIRDIHWQSGHIRSELRWVEAGSNAYGIIVPCPKAFAALSSTSVRLPVM